MKVDVKFPCGYEFHASTGDTDKGYVEMPIPATCPIHGSNCPHPKGEEKDGAQDTS